MDSTSDLSTEQLIKEAAREIFMVKGLDGARMQDIADKAGINKALLHYYFRSKEKLFEIVFEEGRKDFMQYLSQVLDSEVGVLKKVELIVERQIENMLKAPFLPSFIIGEILKRPELIEMKKPNQEFTELIQKFIKEINKEVKAGKLRNITGEQLILNIFSLDIFPFIGRPFFTKMLDMNDEQYLKLMQKRKKDVAQFIINSIKIEEPPKTDNFRSFTDK